MLNRFIQGPFIRVYSNEPHFLSPSKLGVLWFHPWSDPSTSLPPGTDKDPFQSRFNFGNDFFFKIFYDEDIYGIYPTWLIPRETHDPHTSGQVNQGRQSNKSWKQTDILYQLPNTLMGTLERYSLRVCLVRLVTSEVCFCTNIFKKNNFFKSAF